jgi:hypothetical protein
MESKHLLASPVPASSALHPSFIGMGLGPHGHSHFFREKQSGNLSQEIFKKGVFLLRNLKARNPQICSFCKISYIGKGVKI